MHLCKKRRKIYSNIHAPMHETGNNLFLDFLNDAAKVIPKKGNSFHPTKGTGQIIDKFKIEIQRMRGKIYLNAKITAINYKEGSVRSVRIIHDGEEVEFYASQFVSSLPIPIVSSLFKFNLNREKSELSFQRGVITVYLFTDTPIFFPHHNLRVSCNKTTFSRVTNYAAFEGNMVPEGKGCICMEYY